MKKFLTLKKTVFLAALLSIAGTLPGQEINIDIPDEPPAEDTQNSTEEQPDNNIDRNTICNTEDITSSDTVNIDSSPVEEPDDSPVRYFERKLTTNVFARNNFFYFSPGDEHYWSMKPAETGFTIIWKKISFGLSFGIPFTTLNDNVLKSSSFDFQFNHFGRKFYTGGSASYYSVFRRTDLLGNNYFDMLVFSGGLFCEYLLNNKNHALHAIYNMDAEQTVSSGSYLVGGSINTTLSQSDSAAYPIPRSILLHYGPNLGYSYTWVFNSRMFVNAMMIASFNTAVDCASGDWYFALQTRPKIAVGKHFDTWSINGVFDVNATTFMGTKFLNFDAINFTVTFSKRWQVVPWGKGSR